MSMFYVISNKYKQYCNKKNDFWIKNKIIKIISSINFHEHSKQYNWIKLCGLIFYSKYKNCYRLSIKFKFSYELNWILHVF
jgi:hypothetical protein